MTLPDDFLVRRCDEHWIIVGPTGLFAVGRANGDLRTDTRDTVTMARVVRTRLADVVPWVPFVNAVVVGDRDRHDLSCPVVDLDGLVPLIRDGGTQLDDSALHALRHHVPGVVQSIGLDAAAAH